METIKICTRNEEIVRYHLFTNTKAGARFADKTREAFAFEQLRTRRTCVIVYTRGYKEWSPALLDQAGRKITGSISFL